MRHSRAKISAAAPSAQNLLTEHRRDAATVTAMYHAACGMLAGCCPRAVAVLEEAEPDALAYLDFPPTHWKRLRTNNVQERTNREIKRRSRVVQAFPSTGSPVRLAGAAMCERDEIWQESRYFSEVRMNELYDDGRARGIDGPVESERGLGRRPGRCSSPASSLRTGSRRHGISAVFQILGRRADSLRIGLYTNFLDTTEYVANKMSEGHTKMEAIRCPKRYIAREVHYVIKGKASS